MTKPKQPKSVDPRQSERDALAATVAMGKLLPADDGDPAHQPITDWSIVSPNWCSVDDLLNYIAEHGRNGIPQDLIDGILKRGYGAEDDGDERIEDYSPSSLANFALTAAETANSLNFALHMMSLTFTDDLEKGAVSALCEQIEVNLTEVIEKLTELDRRKLMAA